MSRDRITELEEYIKQANEELFELKRFGRDRFEEGDVIRFTKTFAPGSNAEQTYTYVALKGRVSWHLSGDETLSYDKLIAKIVQAPAADDVEVAVRWVSVLEEADRIQADKGE